MSLDILRTLGEDALANHFEMIIPPHVGATNLVNTNLRVLTVDIPDKSIDTYEIIKDGRKMTRPTGVSGMANEFSFTFRVDKFYQTYKDMTRWMDFIQDSRTNNMASDSGPLGAGGASEYRVPVTVLPLDANLLVTNPGWLIEGCWPSSISGISFDESSGEPLIASVTMQFIAMNYL